MICETNETPEPLQIQHLRNYSNYVTPKLGIFSADTWALIATYLRNAFVNQLVIVPLLAALLLLPRLTAELTQHLEFLSGVVAIPALCLTAIAVWCASYSAGRQTFSFRKRNRFVLLYLPLFLAALVLLWFPFEMQLAGSPDHREPRKLAEILAVVGLCAAAFAAINLIGWLIYSPTRKSPGARRRPGWARAAWVIAALVGGLIGGYLFAEIFVGIGNHYWALQPWHLVTWGPPIALLLFVIALNIQLGIRGKYESDMSREWWASMTGWLLAFATGWWLVSALSIYSPLLFELFHDWTKTQYALIGSWLLTTLGAILAGRSPQSGALRSTNWMDYAAKTLAPIAVIGLLIAIAIGINAILQYWTDGTLVSVTVCANEGKQAPTWCDTIWKYWGALIAPELEQLLGLLALCLLVGIGMGSAIDVNQLSMHTVYRNRLVRCYLRAIRKTGASKPNEVHGFDPKDDFPLACLASSSYQGPYLLINTALNITDPRILRWQERKAAAFILAPKYCGSNLTGYRDTIRYADTISLGTALAISGAAYTPNMGYHSNRALAFFLAMFNVRLGGWVGNPRHEKYDQQGPRWGLYYLLAELLGRANRDRDYVYLSDGGHFDNLGIYELVRRRCRYIVCCDADEDSLYRFDDLGMAIRKIRADFGVDIEINLDMIKPQEGQRYSRRHVAIGTIRYDMADKNSLIGMLVYIKASLVGDEPADVLEYKAHHPEFPHETTLDQFFSESQFEAYRALGEHIGREVFRPAQLAL